jgi:hypothetical protein
MSERQTQTQLSSNNALFVNPNTGEYLFDVPELYSSQQNTTYLKILSAQFPISWYNINSTLGNTLTFLLNSSSIVSIQIPEGNYDGKTLAAAIQSQVNTANFSVSFNQLNSKLQFSYNLPLSILGSSSSFFLMKICGFIPNNNYLATFQVSTNQYLLNSYYPINLSQINYICISLPNFNTQGINLNLRSNETLLCSVPVNGLPMTNIIFENQNNLSVDCEKNDLRQFRIKITDQYGIPINFNGADWNMNILFEFVRFVD